MIPIKEIKFDCGGTKMKNWNLLLIFYGDWDPTQCCVPEANCQLRFYPLLKKLHFASRNLWRYKWRNVSQDSRVKYQITRGVCWRNRKSSSTFCSLYGINQFAPSIQLPLSVSICYRKFLLSAHRPFNPHSQSMDVRIGRIWRSINHGNRFTQPRTSWSRSRKTCCNTHPTSPERSNRSE